MPFPFLQVLRALAPQLRDLMHPISNSWGSGSGCGVRGLILSVRSREAYRHSPTRPRKHQAIVAKWTEALSGRLRYCEISEFCANVYICSGQDCSIPYLLSCSPSDICRPHRKDLTSSIRSYKHSYKKKKKKKKKKKTCLYQVLSTRSTGTHSCSNSVHPLILTSSVTL